MRNTMKKTDYLKEHISGSIVIFWGFREIFFKCIPGLTSFESMFVLVTTGIFIMGIGISMDWENNRNYVNVVQNIIWMYGVFVCIAYIDIYKNRILLLVLMAVISSIIVTTMVLKRTKNKKKKCIRNRKYIVTNVWRRIFTVAFSALLIPLVVSVIVNGKSWMFNKN